jgi:hypothetical protein
MKYWVKIIHKLKNLFWIVKYTIVSMFEILNYYMFVQTYLNKIFTKANKKLEFRVKMYATVVPFIIAFPYSKLTGSKLSKSQLEVLLLISGIMPVHDTLLDNADFKITDLKSLLTLKDENNFMSHLELLRILFFKLNKLIDATDLELLEEIHVAQLESLKQKNPDTSLGEIEQILRQKGGLTAVLYAQIVNHEFSKKDKKMLIECGYWVQLFDDLMDYKKDKNEGVRTLANQFTKEEYLSILKRQRDEVF